jgi:hypothetical protein
MLKFRPRRAGGGSGITGPLYNPDTGKPCMCTNDFTYYHGGQGAPWGELATASQAAAVHLDGPNVYGDQCRWEGDSYTASAHFHIVLYGSKGGGAQAWAISIDLRDQPSDALLATLSLSNVETDTCPVTTGQYEVVLCQLPSIGPSTSGYCANYEDSYATLAKV